MTESRLPPYVTKSLVAERLLLIFPEGTPNRNYCTRDLAVSTIFTMLYIGALEGSGTFLAPKHVYSMTDEIAADNSDTARRAYAENALKPKYRPSGDRWYADNTREPIRDETLREGFVALGAVVCRNDLPTTSSKPRYALNAELSELFNPALEGEALQERISRWQERHLSKGALTRIAIQRRGAAASTSGVMVTFPNGETRRLAPGPSSAISQAVIESFAPRFLKEPVVLWLSESGNKVVARDDAIANEIGLQIEADKNLPDIILADLAGEAPLIVFVEVVATDGPITERRRAALLELTDKAGFDRRYIAFLTAYADRDAAPFKKTVSSLSWGSFAWFASEPENLVGMFSAEQGHALLREHLSIAQSWYGNEGAG